MHCIHLRSKSGLKMPVAAQRTLACWSLLLIAVAAFHGAEGVMDGDCYQFGSGGWDLTWWGNPHVRLPDGDGTIPICATGFGSVVFRWKDPAGVFLIPSERCPESFDPPWNDTFTELAPVSDSNRAGFVWLPPQVAGGVYWFTSQVPGACEAGVKVRVEVVGPVSGAGEALPRREWQPLVAAVLLALAASAAIMPSA